MCGLYGSTAGRVLGREALAHRGPDSYGVFRDRAVVLEHWRLSIIDLSSAGTQPMQITRDGSGGAAGRLVMAYNGEVYNFKDLKNRLPGVEFQSGTDTEVVLRLYGQFGLESLKLLNGMFAFAIYDEAARRVVLARDRFGIKPLYYHLDDEGHLSFASELHALVGNRPDRFTLDTTAIQSLFHLLYIEGERTPFEEIRKLPPGSYLVYDLDTRRVQIVRYHEFGFQSQPLSESAALNRIDELLAESVRLHLVSDVPIGALLSGGVDSGLLVALMKRYCAQVHTFSVGYEDNKLFDESKYFNAVAAQYQTDHHHTVVRQGDLGALLDEVCAVLDEPIGDTSVFLNHFIFGFVSRSVKVCLSGLGGDELFGGYNRHLACQLLPVYTGLPAAVRGGLERLIALLPASRGGRLGNRVRLVQTFLKQADPDLGRAYGNFIDYFNGRPSAVLAPAAFANTRLQSCWEERLVEDLNRIYKYDLENYMVNDLLFLTDRMSMRHSLEARVPYLENSLVDFAMSLAPRRKIKGFTAKYLLKKVAERYLPREVIYRRKQGFSSPIRGLLSPAVLEGLSAQLASGDEPYLRILNRPLFAEIIAAHRQGRQDHSLQIFTLLVYLKWMRHCFAGSRIADRAVVLQ